MFALLLAPLLALAGPAAPSAVCADSPAQITVPAVFNAPLDIHATSRVARVMFDLGSDGRVRRLAITQSSGNETFDAAALAAAKRMRFAPPTQNCISISFTAPQDFSVPLIDLVAPAAPGSATLPPVVVPKDTANAICGAPFVQLTGLDYPAKRQLPGTAAVDVALDASAHVTNVRLVSSSGHPATDAYALASAKSGQYQFVLQPGCAPRATVYRLELTYH